MHQPIREHLEEYLSGRNDLGGLEEFEDHLACCEVCRREVGKMRRQTELLRELQPPSGLYPKAGFYVRVLDRIESERIPSIWDLLIEPVFARHLAYASLGLLLLLGTLLVAGGRQQPVTPNYYAYSPEVILSQKPKAQYIGDDVQRDREVVLVKLATYRY